LSVDRVHDKPICEEETAAAESPVGTLGGVVSVTVVTVKFEPLLATPPTVTTTLPLVAPVGTLATILLELQLIGVAAVPLNFKVLEPWVAPKLVPVMVTVAPTTPLAGVRLMMLGDMLVTVKLTPLLATPPTLTTTFPVVAAAGTGTAMLVALHEDGVAAVLLNLTVLVP
jgi:hypothetical protein